MPIKYSVLFVLIILTRRSPIDFSEIRDLAHFKAGIRDFEGKGDLAILTSGNREMSL